jgi:hypothetical protein
MILFHCKHTWQSFGAQWREEGRRKPNTLRLEKQEEPPKEHQAASQGSEAVVDALYETEATPALQATGLLC